MIIVCLKTDQPTAYIGLFEDHRLLADVYWDAHRELSNTIYQKLQTLLDSQDIKLKQIDGFVCFKGPGSFTGLRIGLSVANALAYANNAMIVTSNHFSWKEDGVSKLLAGKDEKIALPEYGSEANITSQKK